jgi:general L-amino acid transport system permease protein
MILFAAAYLAEVVRGGLQAIPRQQVEAAQALGHNYWQRTWYVILPQALRIAIPPLVNTFIGFFKDTSLVVIIGLFDFLTTIKVSLAEPAWSGFGVEAYSFAAVGSFLFCYPMSRYSRDLERTRPAEIHMFRRLKRGSKGLRSMKNASKNKNPYFQISVRVQLAAVNGLFANR